MISYAGTKRWICFFVVGVIAIVFVVILNFGQYFMKSNSIGYLKTDDPNKKWRRNIR